jgi:hypothetical protein
MLTTLNMSLNDYNTCAALPTPCTLVKVAAALFPSCTLLWSPSAAALIVPIDSFVPYILIGTSC